MKIFFVKQALKSIERLDKATKQRIHQAIYKLPEGDIKRLKGYSLLYRLRVGDWRIIFQADANEIIIENILPRGSSYK